ncbi:MAG: DUF5674 family protein [Firmicutes bacterium]|nr:DUF5674 family protein [Bacillota bacterium]
MKEIDRVTVSELKELAKKMMDDIVKADVDIKKEIVVIDAALHADMEAYLLENGSNNEDIWGINLHPYEYGTENFIEFDSMINLKPRCGNRSRDIEDEKIKEKIIKMIRDVIIDA